MQKKLWQESSSVLVGTKGGTEKRPEEILEGGKKILYHGCGSSSTCVHTEWFFFGLTVKHVGS